MALQELLPPDPGVSSRRQARERRSRRRSGPIVAGFVVVAAAATGSAAALMMGGPTQRADVAAYPSASGPQASRGGMLPRLPAAGATGGAGTASPGSQAGSADQGDASGDPSTGGAPAPSSSAGSATSASANGMPGGVAYRGPAWPALTYTLKATSNGMVPAPFPASVPGYVLKERFSTRLTVAEGKYFTVFGDLPVQNARYDVCRRQRFFVRWQATGARAVVESTFVDALVRTVQNRPVSGSAGWQSSFGCVQPAVRIRPPAGVNPAKVVVVAEMQVWERR